MGKNWLNKIFESLLQSRIRLHVLFWISVILGFIAVHPYEFQKFGWLLYLLVIVIKFMLLIGMVYINLYILIPKYAVFKKKISIYILLLILLNILIACLWYLFEFYLYLYLSKPGDEVRDLSDHVYFFSSQFISNFWYLGSTSALQFARRYFKNQLLMKETSIAKLETEVKYLVAQINPHFLFNAINTIYVQIDRQNIDARETITKFSEMLRYQLYECNVAKVSLDKEIAYIQNYVDIQKLRKSERHRVSFTHPANTDNIYLPPLLFIGFVENAFKFVSNDKNRDNYVLIDMDFRENRLYFKVENTVLSNTALNNFSETGGIGLSNIKRRLELQFKDKHELNIESGKECFIINLQLEIE
ncbi:MAG: histidine kinase [Chitinophagaceae bacterium]|nr:histidine kinase [Chitinophagaceae bacterium]